MSVALDCSQHTGQFRWREVITLNVTGNIVTKNQFLENTKYDGVRKLIKSLNSVPNISVPNMDHNVKYANSGLHIYI